MSRGKHFGLGLVLIAGSASSVVAQEGPLNLRAILGQLDGDNDMIVDRNEVPEKARPAFEKILAIADSNKNGKLEPDEVREILAGARMPQPAEFLQRLKKMDSDGDGKISKTEFTGPELAFGRLDSDKDGFISKDELKGRNLPEKPEPAKQPASSASARFKAMDSDQNGKVSRGEFKGPESLFNRIDTDRDGSISGVELEKLKERIAKAVPVPGDRPLFERIRDLDANKDRKISRDEFKGPEAAFKRLDRNGDGVIDRKDAAQSAPEAKPGQPRSKPDKDASKSKE